jgi:hypothetical protein
MKVADYRDLISSVRDQFASCRGCLLNERPNEAKILRKLVIELVYSVCPRANVKDKTRAQNVIGEATKWLADNGL